MPMAIIKPPYIAYISENPFGLKALIPTASDKDNGFIKLNKPSKMYKNEFIITHELTNKLSNLFLVKTYYIL